MKEKTEKIKAPVLVVEPLQETAKWEVMLWRVLLSAALMTGGLLALISPWRNTAMLGSHPWVMGILALACGLAAITWKWRFRWLLWLVPWGIAGVCCLIGNPLEGFLAWINAVITRWNIAHDDGIRLLSVNASNADCRMFVAVSCTAFGQAVAGMMAKKQGALCGIVVFLILAAELESGLVSTLSVCLLVMAILGYAQSDGELRISRHAGEMWLATLAALCLVASVLPVEAMPEVTSFRVETQERIHTARYGENHLPEGDLYQTEKLHAGQQETLVLRSEYAEDGYLPAFYGGTYSGGAWHALTGSAYGGDYTGMFRWLAKRGFYPQTQLASYYTLCEQTPSAEKDQLLRNRIRLENTGVSREYVYTTAALETFDNRDGSANNDGMLKAKGLFGQRNYAFTEFTQTQPGELSVTAAWVTNPGTAAQEQYLESEAVYRDFVYNTYTQVNPELAELIRTYFREDTELSGDGIFTVLIHIRNTLRSNALYTTDTVTIPRGEDPIAWFLTEGRQGNAMLFASAAVEAFRGYGIPARYVEGFRYTADSLTGNGEAVLTEQNNHAWVEVYFDGMGWIPVDVTPGFYYDIITLQRLVKVPENAQRTSALLDNQEEAEQTDGGESEAEVKPPEKTGKLADLAYMLILLASGICIFGVLFVLGLELARAVWRIRLRLAYQKADLLARAGILERLTYSLLGAAGIHGSLGWRTQQLDKEISDYYKDIQPGEYTRSCTLLEKALYGQLPPEVYEERTLLAFLKKLGAWPNLRARLRGRYTWIGVQ